MSRIELAEIAPVEKIRVRAFILRNMRSQGAFLVTVALILVARLIWLHQAYELLSRTILISIQMVVTAILLALFVLFAHQCILKKSPVAAIRSLRERALAIQNIQYAIPAALAGALLMNSFAHFKSSIPSFNAYDIDPLLAEIDRMLHFGLDPWRITEAVFGYGQFTWMVDKLYYLWFMAVFVPLGAALISPPSVLRHRFLLSFALVWAGLGIVLATLMASGGPIFYDGITGGPSEFTPLIETLTKVDAAYGIQTMRVREMLWAIYAQGTSTTISGISAMPSVHNAMCVLLVLAARHIDRRLALLALAFAVIIFIGSVHLGWHYAIDAYVSIIAVPVIWKFAGWVAAGSIERGHNTVVPSAAH